MLLILKDRNKEQFIEVREVIVDFEKKVIYIDGKELGETEDGGYEIQCSEVSVDYEKRIIWGII